LRFVFCRKCARALFFLQRARAFLISHTGRAPAERKRKMDASARPTAARPPAAKAARTELVARSAAAAGPAAVAGWAAAAGPAAGGRPLPTARCFNKEKKLWHGAS
jgi:hypothetical protein